MSPGAVAVTRTSWCQCELPTHLCANVPLSRRQGPPNPHSYHPPRAWPERGGWSKQGGGTLQVRLTPALRHTPRSPSTCWRQGV